MGCLKLDILEQSFVPMQIVYKRALGIDPLADQGGQQTLSPYHAMGCNPALMVDSLGLLSNPNNDISSPYLTLKTPIPVYIPIKGNSVWNAINRFENIPILSPSELARQEFYSKMIVASLVEGIFNGRGAVLYSGLFSGGSGRQTNDGDSYESSEKKFEGIDALFPESGMYRIGNIQYDLNSFIKFHKEYGKIPARKNKINGEKIKIERVTVNGKSVDLYSEAGSYLSIEQNGFYFVVSFSTPNFLRGGGTSFGFNYMEEGSYLKPLFNSSLLRIHTHPFGDAAFNMSFNYGFGRATVQYNSLGPSAGDYNYYRTKNTNYSLRNVVIDNAYIYLYNRNPSQTIRIKR